MKKQLPVVNAQAAVWLEENLGWVEGRDYWLTPDLPLEA